MNTQNHLESQPKVKLLMCRLGSLLIPTNEKSKKQRDSITRTKKSYEVGLEDNIWLEKGVLATNESLVKKATTIIEAMGSTLMSPQQVRDLLGLTKRAPR